MVLLAAAVCNKGGKAIISRQFVEMNRSRIEGLLAAFPKLMGSGKQHTFVETESVRYVYQPLEKLYMLLITTKASNILEDLETLRLFARVIPEYCRNLEEMDITDNSFQLIFAFDEIVALGYRESVNLGQIRTFTEMDSHEEKVFQAVRQTQEREAKENMKRKAKELQQQRRDQKRSGRPSTTFSGGFGSNTMGGGRSDNPVVETNMSMEPTKPVTTMSRPTGGRGMKLGSKGKDVDAFVDQLKSEGEAVASDLQMKQASRTTKPAVPAIKQDSVHMQLEEKISLIANRDGGVETMDIHGMLTLKISEEQYTRIRLLLRYNDSQGVQYQTHPNIDKKLFATASQIALKNPTKPFPVNQDIGVLKWRFQTTESSMIPLTINCWPNETNSGCDVNIEYELQRPDLELNDVIITIPVPSGVGAPVVNECEGEYKHDSRKSVLLWSLPLIDENNKNGTMEFSMASHPDDFFPVTVSFVSKKPYCDFQLVTAQMVDGNETVKFSSQVVFAVEKYEIV